MTKVILSENTLFFHFSHFTYLFLKFFCVPFVRQNQSLVWLSTTFVCPFFSIVVCIWLAKITLWLVVSTYKTTFSIFVVVNVLNGCRRAYLLSEITPKISTYQPPFEPQLSSGHRSQWLAVCGRPLRVCMTAGGMVCFAAPTGLVAPVASSITTSEQAFQITGSPVTLAGQVLAAKLPLPANSKIVTLNMPTTHGGMESKFHPFLLVFTFARMDVKNVMWAVKCTCDVYCWGLMVPLVLCFFSFFCGWGTRPQKVCFHQSFF